MCAQHTCTWGLPPVECRRSRGPRPTGSGARATHGDDARGTDISHSRMRICRDIYDGRRPPRGPPGLMLCPVCVCAGTGIGVDLCLSLCVCARAGISGACARVCIGICACVCVCQCMWGLVYVFHSPNTTPTCSLHPNPLILVPHQVPDLFQTTRPNRNPNRNPNSNRNGNPNS